MKIGFDAKRVYHNSSGLGNYGRFLIDALLKYSDISPVLYTPSKTSLWSNNQVEVREAPALLRPTVFSKWATIGGSIWRSAFQDLSWEKDGLDLYHGLSAELPSLNFAKSIPKVVTIHDVIFKHHPDYYRPIDVSTYDKKTTRAIELSSGIVAISEATKRDLIRYYNVEASRITVHYQDCLPQFKMKLNEGDITQVKQKYALPSEYVLCVGTVEQRKQQGLVVEQLAKSDVSIPLVLVGRHTDYAKEVMATAKNLGYDSKIIWLDNARFVDFPSIYQGASVFVQSSEIEGFGIPLVEAMNSGVPVITRLGGVSEEVCQEAAHYFHDAHGEDLGDAITKVLSDNDLNHSLVNLGYQRAKAFEPQKTIPDLVDLYRGLIE